MILMPQIFDVTANENARYKRNELEILFIAVSQFLIRIMMWLTVTDEII